MPLKVQTIARQLSPRFPAANYGLASGVKTSAIKLQGSKLFIVAPAYLCDSKKPLPSFLCGSASRLAHHRASINKLDSSMLKMAFPVMMSPGFEVFGHGVSFAVERGEGYLIGLTPFDQALGIRGVTRYDKFWDQFVVRKYQELELLRADRVIESCGWDLFEKHGNYIPLAARNYNRDRLGLISLQLCVKKGSFCLSTTTRVVSFHEASSAFIGNWASDLSVRLPLDKLDTAVRAIERLGEKPDLFKALIKCRYSDYYEPDFDLKLNELRAPVAALYNKALPALINIAERLPLEEISGLGAAAK